MTTARHIRSHGGHPNSAREFFDPKHTAPQAPNRKPTLTTEEIRTKIEELLTSPQRTGKQSERADAHSLPKGMRTGLARLKSAYRDALFAEGNGNEAMAVNSSFWSSVVRNGFPETEYPANTMTSEMGAYLDETLSTEYAVNAEEEAIEFKEAA